LSTTRIYPIDINKPDKVITSGHLHLGGSDPAGNTLAVTNSYVSWNGKPRFFISGEFHYSRCLLEDWETELLKIKAGGVNVVATYVFWSFHETQPGVFDWQGQKDLRRFVELCGKVGVHAIIRIGPFAHGEWRNGGLPDWLYGQPFNVRSNDAGYLAQVERLYNEIGQQVKGLGFAEGGPIIGIQLENEYMHAGAPWEVVDQLRPVEWIPAGHEGAEHLKSLKVLAHKANLEAPLYLVTAWGAPIIEDETLPVYGGYAYPVWVEEPGPSDYFVFQDGHAQPVEAPTHRAPNYYPLVYAEMQGGIQNRYNNRPVVPPESVEALALVCVGNGSNWLGYYMYHGGTTPRSGQGYSNERLHPQLSYDFQAPLGEFGEYHQSYHGLKLLHYFLAAYAEDLGLMGTLLPEGAVTEATDTSGVRYCVRTAGGRGFLFVNNFQDHFEMTRQEGVVFEFGTAAGKVRIPETGSLTIEAGVSFILPFNQRLVDAQLIYATAQPLTILKYDDVTHYFYFAPEGIKPEYCLAEAGITGVTGDCEQGRNEGRITLTPKVGRQYGIALETAGGQTIRITTLSRAEAEQIWKGNAWGVERVLVSEAGIVFGQAGIEARSHATEWGMTVWPPVNEVTAGEAEVGQTTEGVGTVLKVKVPNAPLRLEVKQVSERKYMVQLPEGIPAGVSEVFLKVDYEGDTGMAFDKGCLVADNFNNGTPWLIGLKRFAKALASEGLCLVFSPLRQGVVKNVSSQLAGRFEFEGKEKLIIHSISAFPEYKVCLEQRFAGVT
jgi:Glycosyl hydrolases family 35/Beta-galactosidase, domain 2